MDKDALILMYQRHFATNDGKVILEDLKRVFLGRPTQDIINDSPHLTAYSVGLNAAWRYIERIMETQVGEIKQNTVINEMKEI